LNLQVQNAYSVNINSPFNITKWWTGNVNFNLFYLGFKSPDLLGAQLNNGQTAYQGKLSQTITFLKTWRLETFANYKSALTFGIYDVRPQYNFDAGISHSFAQKRANIKFSVSDIFDTRTNNVNINYQTAQVMIKQKGETRVARISLTYNFGNAKIKARQRQTGTEEESSRVKGAN
jgi:iron complex outermembrane recepter protein